MQQNTKTKIRPQSKSENKLACSLCLLLKKQGGREITYLDANIRTPFSTTNTVIGSRLLKENHSSNHSFPSYTVLRFGNLYVEMVQGSISDMTIHYYYNTSTTITHIYRNTGPLKHKKHSIYNYSHKLRSNHVTVQHTCWIYVIRDTK